METYRCKENLGKNVLYFHFIQLYTLHLKCTIIAMIELNFISCHKILQYFFLIEVSAISRKG